MATSESREESRCAALEVGSSPSPVPILVILLPLLLLLRQLLLLWPPLLLQLVLPVVAQISLGAAISQHGSATLKTSPGTVLGNVVCVHNWLT